MGDILSGYELFLLVQADSREDALKEAEGAIESFFRDGDLHEGDKGVVDGDSILISKNADKNAFKATIEELTQNRQIAYETYVRNALEQMARLGYASLTDVPVEEAVAGTKAQMSVGIIGYYLRMAGTIQTRMFTPQCVLYDAEEYVAGVDTERLNALLKDEEDYWLVSAIVG